MLSVIASLALLTVEESKFIFDPVEIVEGFVQNATVEKIQLDVPEHTPIEFYDADKKFAGDEIWYTTTDQMKLMTHLTVRKVSLDDFLQNDDPNTSLTTDTLLFWVEFDDGKVVKITEEITLPLE